MDVDSSSSDSSCSDDSRHDGGLSSNLKRSNSAPMINLLGHTRSCSESEIHAVSTSAFYPNRTRRFSAGPGTNPSPTLRIPSRVSQIKQEEGMDLSNAREVNHERELRSAIQISRSCDELHLDDGAENNENRSKPVTEPLHILPWSHNALSCSPSPTRCVGKQCFSPSMGAPVRASSFSPSPSPSPTRKSFTRRSSSPIRPSALAGVKRKVDSDHDDPRSCMSPPKKICNSPGAYADRISYIPHPVSHSLSSSSSASMEEDSPEQRVLALSANNGSPITISTANNNSSQPCWLPHFTHPSYKDRLQANTSTSTLSPLVVTHSTPSSLQMVTDQEQVATQSMEHLVTSTATDNNSVTTSE